MFIKSRCPICGKVYITEIDMSNEDFSSAYNKWQSGELIQNAFPNLNPSEREALMTGICDDCFPSCEE